MNFALRPKVQYLQTTYDAKHLTKWLDSFNVFLFLRILFFSLIPNKTELNSGSLVTQNLSWSLESKSLVYMPWFIYAFLLISPDIFLLSYFQNYTIYVRIYIYMYI